MATSTASGKGKNGAPRKGPTGSGSLPYTHADFTYVRRKRKLEHGDDESHELNIVPYLDILINLIMFLLVTQATLVALGIVDVSAPSYASIGPSAGQKKEPTEEALKLTIGIAERGFFIAAKGGVLPGEENGAPQEQTADNVTRAAPTIPKRADGTYDFPALTAKLRAIKTAFPATEAVFIAAEDQCPYEIIVKTLDASREDARGPLFPAVAFTQIN
jgi:biopolymer transport protein ExbD